MITKQRLLLAIATEIADATGCDNDKALAAARGAFHQVGLNVVLPLLDALDFSAKSVFREIVINEVRDLLVDADEEKAERPENMEIPNE
jgi:hypothetical protein